MKVNTEIFYFIIVQPTPEPEYEYVKINECFRDVIMEDFFNKGFFSNNQYGFIKGRSTVLQLLKIFDDWTYQMDHSLTHSLLRLTS